MITTTRHIQELNIESLSSLFKQLDITETQRLRCLSTFFLQIIDSHPSESFVKDPDIQKKKIVRVLLTGLERNGGQRMLEQSELLEIGFFNLLKGLSINDIACNHLKHRYMMFTFKQACNLQNQRLTLDEIIQSARLNNLKERSIETNTKTQLKMNEYESETKLMKMLQNKDVSSSQHQQDSFILNKEALQEVKKKIQESEECPYEDKAENRQLLMRVYASSHLHAANIESFGEGWFNHHVQQDQSLIPTFGMIRLAECGAQLSVKIQNSFFEHFQSIPVNELCLGIKQAPPDGSFCPFLPQELFKAFLEKETQLAEEAFQRLEAEKEKIPMEIRIIDFIPQNQIDGVIQKIQSSEKCPYDDNPENKKLLAQIFLIQDLNKKGALSFANETLDQWEQLQVKTRIIVNYGMAEIMPFLNDGSIFKYNTTIEMMAASYSVTELINLICPQTDLDKKIHSILDETTKPSFTLRNRVQFFKKLQCNPTGLKTEALTAIPQAIQDIEQEIKQLEAQASSNDETERG